MLDVNKLFVQKDEVVLTEEERGTITDLVTIHPEIWKVIEKYLYNKVNVLTRKMVNCQPEELKIYQECIKSFLEPMKDFQKIKKDYLQKNKKGNKITKVKDFWYYVTGQDTRGPDGKIRLSAR